MSDSESAFGPERALKPNETALIERIGRLVPSRAGVRSGDVRLGIGDDAAVVRPRPGRELVISTDQFLEDAHFLATRHPAHAVGYKALARATSDLAAMGAAPRYFFLTLALPPERTGAWLDEFCRGMAGAARRFAMILLGGDVARQRAIGISLTVVGEVSPGEAVTRSGGRPGDAIFVSGTLGAAALGLKLFLRGIGGRGSQSALNAHLYPQPRLGLGAWLARGRLASAMIDLSDGFSTDLGHLCDASGVGARVQTAVLPLVEVPASARRLELDAMELGLHGGEDYELLFTVPRRLVSGIPSRFGSLKVTRIGEITKKPLVRLVDTKGKTRTLLPSGWDHFR